MPANTPQTEISQAFEHPEARAIATAGAGVADRISLRDHVVETEIGAFQQERGLIQRLRFNMVVELVAQEGAATDDVDLILSYDTLAAAIAQELAAERLNLLETLAERIAARVLREPLALRVFVRIEKLDRGPWELGVEIVRSRADVAPGDAEPAPRPVVVWFQGAIADLAQRMEKLSALAAPVIITLAPPDMPRPKAPALAQNQRRIDLLAIEQAAWALASRDPRLSVVATRTEIDYAMRHGQMIVWAPSKMICDTAGTPEAVGDGIVLAHWLAGQLDALKIVVHAPVAAPAESRIAVEIL